MAELSTLARPYAKAAFEFAVSAGELTGWSDQLSVVAAVSQVEKIHKILRSPSLTSDQQAKQFIDVCGDELSDGVKNFVEVLAENKRISLLPEIVGLFEQFQSRKECRCKRDNCF